MVTIGTHTGSESSGDELGSTTGNESSGDELGGTTLANSFLHQETSNPSQATNHP